MPLSTADSSIVVCVVSFAGPAGDCNRGQRLRADHPIVSSAPRNFVSDGTPEQDWPTEYDRAGDELAEQGAAEVRAKLDADLRAAKANRIKVETRLKRSNRDLVTRYGGQPALVERGSTFVESDPIVAEHPDAFV